MIRTQISLTKAQHEYLKEHARKTGESLASTIRRAIGYLQRLDAPVLSQQQPGTPAREDVGGGGDLEVG